MLLFTLLIILCTSNRLAEHENGRVFEGTSRFNKTAGGKWYSINPTKLFTAGFSYSDYNNGACNGFWKDAKFMRSPYITMDSSAIQATITSDVVQQNACIYQHTQQTCEFSLGGDGAIQMEFDFHIEGDRWSNWFSFWVNSNNNGWVPEAEIDPLENMYQSLAHNFAGYGHQVEFKDAQQFDGHVTTRFQSYGAQATDCSTGSSTCDFNGDYAHQEWGGSTTAQIQNGQLKHHLVIDYWKTQLASSLRVWNIRIYGGSNFARQCPGATPMEQ